jgi:hypothetical protein
MMSTPPAAIGAFEKDCPSRSARPSTDLALWASLAHPKGATA